MKRQGSIFKVLSYPKDTSDGRILDGTVGSIIYAKRKGMELPWQKTRYFLLQKKTFDICTWNIQFSIPNKENSCVLQPFCTFNMVP